MYSGKYLEITEFELLKETITPRNLLTTIIRDNYIKQLLCTTTLLNLHRIVLYFYYPADQQMAKQTTPMYWHTTMTTFI